MFLVKNYEGLKIVEYPLHQLIRLARLEIYIALSNLNNYVRIFVIYIALRSILRSILLFQISTMMSESLLRVILLPSLVSFELEIEKNKICKALLIKQETE